MAKEIAGFIKLQIRGGQANPAPPIGPALGAKGVNIMDFCKSFNASTQDSPGKVLPVVITVFQDKSFSYIIKTPPAAVLLMEAANKKKGSPEPNRVKVASVTWDQVKAIAEEKMPDLNAFTVESGMKMVAGTARSMGFIVKGVPPWGGEAVEDVKIASAEEIVAAKEAAAESSSDDAPANPESQAETTEEQAPEVEGNTDNQEEAKSE